jgi:hypothetical protein
MGSHQTKNRERVGGFREEAPEVVSRIRELFATVIEAACGGDPRAHEVADTFRIPRKLGWQIWNVAYDDEPFRGIFSMPTERGLRSWREAVGGVGIPTDLQTNIDEASRLFNDLMETHASDRDTLEMLFATCESNIDPRAEERRRKQAFDGNSFIWGVRANAYVTTLIVHPSQRDGYIDMMRLHGLYGIMRTRPGVRWPFAQAVVYSGGDERFPTRVALEESDAVRSTGVPLLADFCSQPLPPVQRREGELGMLEDELLPGPVGQTGESTVVTGEIVRELAPRFKTQPDEDAMFGTGVRTPCQVLIYDHLVHRDLFPEARRELRVYSELISPVSRDERDLLQVSEQIQNLGAGLRRLRTAEVPHYMQLMEFALQCVGWKAEDLELYRVRMRYPPMPVAVMLRHELPEAPDWFVPS